MKLSLNGFALDNHPEGILIWPRGVDPKEAAAVVTQRGDEFVATKGEGAYGRKKTMSALNMYLKQWSVQYQAGAR